MMSVNDLCHCLTVLGQAVFFDDGFPKQGHCVGEDSDAVARKAKVAIIAPRDEHRSRTYQFPIRMFSKKRIQTKYLSRC